jgi:hypothetical protein
LKNKQHLYIISYITAVSLLASACGIYSFTGAALSPDIKTISIQTFFNESEGGPPNMGQLFTEAMRDYFQQNTSLGLTSRDGDLQFEGSITGYRVTPIATTASLDQTQRGDGAGAQRLTISVKVNYVNTKEEEASFSKSFSFYADFSVNQNFTAVENQLIDEIFEQIILDIFNASVASW